MTPCLIPLTRGRKLRWLMQEPVPAGKKLPWLKIAIGAVVCLVVAVMLLRGMDVNARVDQGLALVRSAGPVVFFLGFALLPSVGAPISAFTLAAGPVFADEFGLGTIVALSLAASAVNIALTYFLARRALRPVLERLLTRLGYRLPQVEAGDATDLVILVRVTPGIPFFVQNYMLGLANVSFGKYLAVSCAITGPTITAFVVFGDALREGRAKVAFISFSLVLALAVATHMLRRHYMRKKIPA